MARRPSGLIPRRGMVANVRFRPDPDDFDATFYRPLCFAWRPIAIALLKARTSPTGANTDHM